MKLDLERILLGSESILPFEAGEDNKDLIENGMNFDIRGRLRKLFSFLTPPTQEDTSDDIVLTNGSRYPPLLHKRKAAEKENSDYKVLTKYRKLETEFPKVIKSPFEDDTKLLKQKRKSGRDTMPSHNHRHQHSSNINNNSSGSKYFSSSDGYFKSKPPRLITIRTTFADHEYSDDEELGISTRPSRNLKKPPPPPLIEKQSGGVLASSIMPALNPIRNVLSSTLSNSSANRAKEASKSKSMQFFTSHYSSKAPPTWDNIFKENKPSSSRYAPSQKISILNEDHQNKEKIDYLKLLQQYEPSLYKTASAQTNEKISNFVANRKTYSTSSKGTTTVNSTLNRAIPLIDSRNLFPSVIDLDGDGDSDEDEVTEIIELDEDDEKLVSVCDKYKSYYITESNNVKEDKKTLSVVEPVNSFQDKINLSSIVKEDNWIANFREKFKQDELHKKIKEAEEENRRCSQNSTLIESKTQEKLKNLHIFDPDCVVIDDFSIYEEEQEEALPELNNEFINKCLSLRPSEVLISKFNLNITRNDINTLLGKNWLNDEVINFYMNLLMERGEQPPYPKVYAMNTFFAPRILQLGHSGVKRWTKKVDIFSYDVIPVPVHVGGVHWCMAIIHLKNKSIKYYDSMGTPNNKILNALETYLREESMDKRKQPFDTSNFVIENVANCPRQNNGSDCGVFSCMFAEYTSRNKEIDFTQDNMEYFRRKMIQEICQGKLLL